MKLVILMPTYNRVRALTVAVDRIIKLISQCNNNLQIQLIVSNNGSTDGTKEYLESINNLNIIICNHYIHSDFSVSLQRAELLVPEDVDWVWWHGDDDLIEENIHPDLILSIVKSLDNGKAVAGHFCGRDSINSNANNIYIDNCLLMCNQFGLISLMGPLSSIFIKRKILKKAFNPYSYAKYSPSAFVHSLCIFEETINYNYALINISIVNQQNEVDHEVNMKRWASELIFDRMFYTADFIFNLSKKLNFEIKLNFFRAHDNNFINILAHILKQNRLQEGVKMKSLHSAFECIYPDLEFSAIDIKIKNYLINEDYYLNRLITTEYTKILAS